MWERIASSALLQSAAQQGSYGVTFKTAQAGALTSAEVPGHVDNLKILQVLLQCLRNHTDSQGVGSQVGLKQRAGDAPVLGGW